MDMSSIILTFLLYTDISVHLVTSNPVNITELLVEENFLEHKGRCVKSCPNGFEPKGKKCVECSAGTCPKRCQIKWEKTMDFLHSGNIGDLEGCTSIDGHLKILDASIRGDPFNNIEPMELSELNKLQSIREITEYLMIQNLNGWGITNFSFLSNLESILGRKADTYGTALNIISNKEIEFLGFTSLKKIAAGHVIIESNTNLCYLDGLKWSKLCKGTSKQTQFIRGNAVNTTHCIPQNKTCHEECRNGCWGPGPKMCINCDHYRYKDECLNNCNRSMLYSDPEKKKKRCFACSPECNSTCTGPNPDQCDACRNYRDGPFCVSSCPQDVVKKTFKYPDKHGICQPCHPNCIDGCTGPENRVGPNGCNKCRISIMSEDEARVEMCLNETESCPSGYFTSRNPPAPFSQLKGEKVCIKCHELCAECEARGATYCNKCKHYRYGDRCVESCSALAGHYADNSTKACEECHQTCRTGCTGPKNWNCLHDVNYKVYNTTINDNIGEYFNVTELDVNTTTTSHSPVTVK